MATEPSARKRDVAIWYVMIAIGSVLLLQWIWVSYSQIETIPFSQFDQLVLQNKVSEVAVGSDTIQGELKEALPSGKKQFITARVDADLAAKLAAWRQGDRRTVRWVDPESPKLDSASIHLLY